jgi:hypothetical protein
MKALDVVLGEAGKQIGRKMVSAAKLNMGRCKVVDVSGKPVCVDVGRQSLMGAGCIVSKTEGLWADLANLVNDSLGVFLTAIISEPYVGATGS